MQPLPLRRTGPEPRRRLPSAAWALFCLTGFTLTAVAQDSVQGWTTSLNRERRLSPIPPLLFSKQTAAGTVIAVDPDQSHQTLLGFGSSFEHSTCSNLFRLPPAERGRVIERLVDPRAGIGMNLMRLCIGTSDFAGEPWYSYDDLPAGETDAGLKHFSIERDRACILPVLKLAREKNPDMLFFASPWSPPGWMKTTGSLIGGELLPQWYPVYAAYFVRFVRAYQAEDLPIHAVTVQNEPGVDRAKARDPKWFYPSCHWSADQERDFIRDHLGPAFRRAGLKTKIWCYDHNYNVEPAGDSDGLGHPRAILRDQRAASFVDGVAFHHYDGRPEGMTQFHGEFPGVPIHFTEGSVFSIGGAHDLIERLRNGACSYNAWVTLLDSIGKPNNGPFPADHAILKLHADTSEVEELFEFYNYGQFMKFIRRGAVRVESTPGDPAFNNVAFRNPDGSMVLVVVNTTQSPKPFAVAWRAQSFATALDATSVATFVWSGRTTAR